ncbi:cysteine and histidine-rich domain-containing protein 1-like [Amphiura filiformis]|uniref:cysteine and histidine-rich domain-containing protein 1-like n=1 Tax=Amphiura filiformis TaxID=82378 RepID=UPI003B225C7C
MSSFSLGSVPNMANVNDFLCYNKGCGKRFLQEENGPETCIHHPGGPIFHDAYKGWSCCKKRTTDFTEFLNIPGCSKGLHNPEKPQDNAKQDIVKSSESSTADKDAIVVEAPKERKPIEPVQRPSDDEPMNRLQVTVGASLKSALAKLSLNKSEDADGDHTDSNKVKIGTTCKNKGCQKEYQGEETNQETCTYHSGVAIFHEGMKFWSCCERKTSDFNNFLNQEGCTKGDHIWILSEEEAKKIVACRHDWHQTGTHAVLSVYCKNSDPEKTTVEANQVCLNITITFDAGKSQFIKKIILEGPIDPKASKVNMLGTKVEIKLKKSEPFSWKRYELPEDVRPDDTGDETPDTDDD